MCQIKKYSALNTITSQGDESHHIYLIYSGSVKLYKNISFRDTDSNATDSLVRTPKINEINHNKQIFLEEVTSGYIIGAYEFFYNLPMQYSAVCSMPCHVFVFDKYIFEKIDIESIDHFRSTLKPYTSDRVLKTNYFQNMKWGIYKKKLVQNILIEKKLSNKRFLTERTPLKLPSKNLTLTKIKLPKIVPNRSKTQPKLRDFKICIIPPN